MRFKKRTVFIAIGLGLIFTSCKKKEDEDGEKADQVINVGEITCKIDGVQRVFSIPGSNTNHYDNNYIGSPTGKLIQVGRTNSDLDLLVIDLFKDLDQMTIPTTYEVEPYDFWSVEEEDELDYGNHKEVMLTYTEMSSFSMYMSWHERGRSKLTITSKSSDLIEGTFEGWLYAYTFNMDDFYSTDLESTFEDNIDSVHVTEGKFKIQLIRGSIIDAAQNGSQMYQ